MSANLYSSIGEIEAKLDGFGNLYCSETGNTVSRNPNRHIQLAALIVLCGHSHNFTEESIKKHQTITEKFKTILEKSNFRFNRIK